MTKHADSHFLVGAGANRAADQVANRAAAAVLFEAHRKLDTFSYHHDGEALAVGLTLPNKLANVFDSEGNFRNEDDVSASGKAGFQSDPAGVAPHDFDHHDAVMGFGSGMDLVHRIGGGIERGIEAESHFRG